MTRVKVLVVGIGNEDCGDDAAGLLVARSLREKGLPGMAVHELCGDATSLLEIWQGAATVYLIDAVSSGAVPGTLHRMDAGEIDPNRNVLRFSTHSASLLSVVELGRLLGQLPRQVIIFGIEGKAFAAGEELSPAARCGIEKAMAAILDEIKNQSE